MRNKKDIFLLFIVFLPALLISETNQTSTWYYGYPKLFLTNEPDKALIVWKNKEDAYHAYQARFVDSNGNIFGDPFPIHSVDNLVFNRKGEFLLTKMYNYNSEYYLDSWKIFGWVYNTALDSTPSFPITGDYWPECGTGYIGVFEKLAGLSSDFLHLSAVDGRAVLRNISEDGMIYGLSPWGGGVSGPSICALNDSTVLSAWVNVRKYSNYNPYDSLDIGLYVTRFSDTTIIDTAVCIQKYTLYNEYEIQDYGLASTELCTLNDSTYQLFVLIPDSVLLYSYLLNKNGQVKSSAYLELEKPDSSEFDHYEAILNVSEMVDGSRSVFISMKFYKMNSLDQIYMNYLYFFDRNGEYTGESYQDSTHNFQKSHKDFDFTFKVGSNRFFNPTLYGEDIYVDVYEGFTKADSFKVGTVTDLNQRRTSVSQDFILEQNYPNPFNPTTSISYRLPAPSDVELTVYNTLGQKVATLVKEKQPAGQYSVNFDAGGLASGVYYCRLQAGNFRQVKKMLLIR